jgi:glycolate oxidase
MIKPEIITQLKSIVGDKNVLLSREDLVSYSYDGTTMWSHMPDVVVLPGTSEQVSHIIKLANSNLIPVTPRGAGTNVSGGSIPIKGGIVLCTTRMDKILDISKGNLVATVEPGVILQDFNLALAKQGLFYPPDPQSFLGCTIGGTVAENAGGPQGVKYGVTKQYILGMEVVLASGEIVKLGGVTVKNRQGYELMMLFTGSEGTLGVITKVTLRLLPLPAAQKTMIVVFDTMGAAGDAVSTILSEGIIPAKIEFLDNWFLRRIEELNPMGLPTDAQTLLLIQSDGNPVVLEMEAEKILDICRKNGAREARAARDNNEALMLWKARSAGFSAIFSSAPTILAEDVTVPRDKLTSFMNKLDEIGKKYNIAVRVIGHAGDGNLHPSIPTDVKDNEHFARASKAMEEIFESALSFGGVISGEHGIGLEKQRFMKKAMDPVALEIMRKIKALLDPNNILNPGKIWEEQTV